MRRYLLIVGMLVAARTARAADTAPVVRWVTTAGGSGADSVAAAAADNRGNLYIVGSTTSLDFPTAGAVITTPGGSPLARISLSTGMASRLFPAVLPTITAAAAAPSNPTILYAASLNQIGKSMDAGSTWTLLSQFALVDDVFGLAVDPTSSATVYAGTSATGVQKSLDGGVTWTGMNDGLTPQPDGSFSVRSVWVDPSASNFVFAATSFGLMRSAVGGGAWTAVAAGNSYSPLVFDPSTAGTLYSGNGNAILKSTDHGATFVQISSLPNQAGVIALAVDPRHAGVLYAGSTAGIYQSTDGGVSWTLRLAGAAIALAGDPNSNTFYAATGAGTFKTADGFATTSSTPINLPSVTQLLVSGPNLFAVSTATTDVFAMKLDNNGNIVYSTYFGGSGSDHAVALAVASDGSLYVTGSTNSADLPATANAYLSKLPVNTQSSGFVFKLSPAGTLDWTTYFPGSNITSIAVDSAGNSYIAGSTGGGLPVTPGAYQTSFQQTVTSNGFFGVIGPTSAFVTKFNAQGSGLVYSTYVPTDNHNNTFQEAGTVAVDQVGDAWIGGVVSNTVSPPSGIPPCVVELNPTGSAVLASAVQTGLGDVASLAFDADSNVYIAGTYTTPYIAFPATPGAFQPAPQPAVPTLSYQSPSGGGADAFVAKWDRSLTHLLAATLLGGELTDAATSIAVDATGGVIVGGYTDSKAFPTRLPFQEPFSSRSGFVAALDANLANLRYSTFLGDGRPFAVAAAAPDGSGNILLAGSTLGSSGAPVGSGLVLPAPLGSLVVANQIALPPAPAVHLDSVRNYASGLAGALTPGEPLLATGAGFDSAAQLVVDGTPLTTIATTGASIVAVVPDGASISGAHTIQVSDQGTLSNSVYAPAAATSPGVYTVDGSGAGQGYILNSDGSLNSPANPAATGSAITVFIAGEGPFTTTNGFAVTPQTPSVYIDGFYCNGIAAVAAPVDGLPGNVYQLSVFVPDPAVLEQNDPDLKNFQFPAQSSIQVRMGAADALMYSQSGVYINIK